MSLLKNILETLVISLRHLNGHFLFLAVRLVVDSAIDAAEVPLADERPELDELLIDGSGDPIVPGTSRGIASQEVECVL